MREIEFWGKRKDNGEWIFGDLHRTDKMIDGERIFFIEEYDDSAREEGWRSTADVDPATVGQYTGLTDSKGVKIFEGDIVSFWNGKIYECTDGDIVIETMPDKKFKKCKQRTEIVFTNGIFRVKNNNAIECFLDAETELEVIGNIHDNPELLEGE
jgi:uncharacterized phage protein (TIGR01671 family)